MNRNFNANHGLIIKEPGFGANEIYTRYITNSSFNAFPNDIFSGHLYGMSGNNVVSINRTTGNFTWLSQPGGTSTTATTLLDTNANLIQLGTGTAYHTIQTPLYGDTARLTGDNTAGHRRLILETPTSGTVLIRNNRGAFLDLNNSTSSELRSESQLFLRSTSARLLIDNQNGSYIDILNASTLTINSSSSASVIATDLLNLQAGSTDVIVNSVTGNVQLRASNTLTAYAARLAANFLFGGQSAGGTMILPDIISGSGWDNDVGIDNPTGAIGRNTSSLRYKSNVTDLEIDSSKIYNLRPIQFGNAEENLPWLEGRRIGLIAEEVYPHIPELVPMTLIDGQHVPDGVNYKLLSVLLLAEMKKLKERIEILESNP